jgi:excisionase family DNA binding protein
MTEIDSDLAPITVRIPVATKLTGISRSRLYELMRSGAIEYLKVGASTLIPVDSLKEFIARCRASSQAAGNQVEQRMRGAKPCRLLQRGCRRVGGPM